MHHAKAHGQHAAHKGARRRRSHRKSWSRRPLRPWCSPCPRRTINMMLITIADAAVHASAPDQRRTPAIAAQKSANAPQRVWIQVCSLQGQKPPGGLRENSTVTMPTTIDTAMARYVRPFQAAFWWRWPGQQRARPRAVGQPTPAPPRSSPAGNPSGTTPPAPLVICVSRYAKWGRGTVSSRGRSKRPRPAHQTMGP